MAAAVGSFAAQLPYWTTLRVALRPSEAWTQDHVDVLVLKDGTLCLGLQVAGLDLYGMEPEQIETHSRCILRALRELPRGAYVQAVFEAGLPFDGLLAAFGRPRATGASALLGRGRSLRHRDLERRHRRSRCALTYWLGWCGALAHLIGAEDGGAKSRWRRLLGGPAAPALGSVEQVQQAVQLLADAAGRFAGVLASMGLALKFLDEAALLLHCHRHVNPDADGRLAAPAPDDSAAPLAGRHPAASLSAQLPLSSLRHNDTQLILGEPPRLLRALGLPRLPTFSDPTLLHDLLFHPDHPSPRRVVVTHRATCRLDQKNWLHRRQRTLQNFLGKGFADQDIAQTVHEHEQVLKEMAHADATLFRSTVVVLVEGEDAYALDRASRQAADGLARHHVALAPFVGQQLDAWLSTLPAYGYRAPGEALLLERSAAHLLPYWIPQQGSAQADLLLENRQHGLEGLTVRVGSERSDAGAVIVGKTGSGKTFLLSHLLKYGVLDQGGHVVVVDNKGPINSSYRPMCELLGGAYICLQDSPDITFNPFPPRAELFEEAAEGDALRARGDRLEPLEQIVCMMAWRDAGTEDVMTFRRSVARDIIALAYRHKSPAQAPVVLSDLLGAFAHYRPRFERLGQVAADMQQRLSVFLDQPRRARLFDRPQALDAQNPFTVFDFAGMDDDPALAAVLISVLASRIEAKMMQLPPQIPKLFAFDEAWAMFAHSAQSCALLSRLYRVARSYGAFCYVLTQSYADIADSAAAPGILANTSLVFLLRQVSHHAQTGALFGLSPRQAELFASLDKVDGKYAECLLVDRNLQRTHVLRYAPTAFDLWCDTSSPRDVALREAERQKKPGALVDLLVDLAQRFPGGAPRDKHPSLTPEQVP